MNVRKLTTMAMLVALSIALIWLIHIPVFPPPYNFLEYDPADIPILIGSFAYGPLAGIILTVIASVIQGLTVSAQSGFYGILMHIIATGTVVLVSGFIYSRKKTRAVAAAALLAGALARAAIMIPANLLVTPIFTGTNVEAVKAILLPIIVPFNLIYSGVNGIVTFAVYKAVSRFIKAERKDSTLSGMVH